MQKATIKLTWLFVLGVFMLAFQQAKAQCNADFTFTVNDTTRVVQFTNTSTPTADSVYQWYFGSGGYSTLKNPSYQFPAAGTYMVCLYYFANNCFDSTCKLVVIDSIAGNSCSANFSFLVNQTTKTVTFNNFSTGPDSNYIWQFGDNSNSTAKNPVHTYGSAGSYTVCLTKTGPVCYDTICKTIVITNPPCDANFTFSVNQSTRTVTFTNTSTGASDSLYQWYFGDNTTSGVKHPVKTYSANGTYLVCLFKNGPTCFDSVCKTVVISQPCDANFIFSVNQSTRTVTFTNTSTGPGDSLYQWSFGDNTSSGVKHPVKTYSANGTYLVCLFKNGPTCFDSVCKTVVISQPCDANFTFSVNHGTKTVTFNNTSTSPDSLYLWNFGDNTSSIFKNPVKTYSSAGTYTVCLYKYGPCYDSICKSVTILPDSCNADFTYSINHSTTTVTFTNLSTGYPDSMYQWYFGSTGSSTLKNPVHNFGALGTYMVCLYKFGNNCWDSTCKVITILPDSCNADFTYSVTPGTTTVTFNNLSTGYPDSMYQWHFGSTGSSTLKNPVHNFGAPGTYMVCLYKFGNNCWDSTCKVITILPDSGCHADFSFTVNDTIRFVQFTNLSVPGGDSSYYWSFGVPGATSRLKNPTMQYQAQGYYMVCLTYINGNCFDSICKPVTVDTLARCGGNIIYSIDQGTRTGTFTFTGASADSFGYSGEFGTWPNSILRNNVGYQQTYTFPGPGTYRVCASRYCYGSCIYVTILPDSCNADFSYSINDSTRTVTFTNLSTGYPDSSYLWYFGNQGTSTQKNPVFTFGSAGTYLVCLYKFGNNCWDSTCKVITIDSMGGSCQASFTYTYNPSNGSLYFNNTSTGGALTYQWTFGGPNGSTSTAKNPSYHYPYNGTYLVCLTVTRSNPFCTSTFCDTITISQGPNLCRPYVNMSPDSSDKFRYMFFAYVGGSGTQYFWDFGDGDSSTQQSPQHTYSQPGTYFACVTTVRFDGCISKVCDTIVIPPDSTSPCEANFSYVLYPDSMDGVNRIAVFTNLSNGSPYAQYFWTFGDGGYSTQVSPIHYYGTNNMFWVNLMMYDSINNCIDSSGQWIYIGPDTTTGLADAAAILHDVNVYPVPFNEIVKVRFTSRTDKPVAVKIYNTIGILQHRETREAVAGTNEYEINAERLARGIYFIELSTDTGTITKRIIK